jgi:hypothetical protein
MNKGFCAALCSGETIEAYHTNGRRGASSEQHNQKHAIQFFHFSRLTTSL